MLIIELNEYNKKLLQRLSEHGKLKNIKRILSWKHCTTYTPDQVSSGFLDPWCQWVSIHTGEPSSVHGLKNLGAVPPPEKRQLWQHWSERNESSIVWGVMNASRADAKACKVFIPDPWTFSEEAHPSSFDGLIELPRYLSKNYISPSKTHVTKKILGLIYACFKNTRPQDWFYGMRILFKGIKQFGKSPLTSIAIFEWFSAMAFLRTAECYKPDHSILFLNMLAHAQHHYWIEKNPVKSIQLVFVAEVIDKILGRCLQVYQEQNGEEQIVIVNAISQKNTTDEAAWVLYVPNSHVNFLKTFDIVCSKVEPLMTNDAQVFFENEQDALRGERRLKALKIRGKPLLHVERHPKNPLQIFYKGVFADALEKNDVLNCENISVLFFEHFSKVVQRTGRHVQEGDILTTIVDTPEALKTYEVFDFFNLRGKKTIW